ncbi:hypothetical protein DL991_30640 [Amycolatopsis sp. WAC 01375]|nr:hypothetical protein DL991_30640 [Amycolatopsis sp. WAC 01375]RSN24864.1 hypothetical protein DL990_33830 [Amycolatopsis sp. WAC 01416]
MSFTVDPDVLDKYAEFLEDVSGGAVEVEQLVTKETKMSAHDEGLINALCLGHETIVESMAERTRQMDRIARGSCSEMHRVAEYYREEEKSNAAKLAKIDEGYPESDFYLGKYEGRGGDERSHAPSSTKWTKFEDIKSELKLDPIPSKEEMIGSKVEFWARNSLNGTSVVGAARLVLENLIGFDFIQSIREWWIGEWEAWAKCATVWKSCAKGVELIAENVHDATDSLHGSWEGMAADAAHVYFEKFRDAIYTEADAFSALQQGYELVMEFIFEIHLLFDDVVNTVLDIVFTILTAGSAKGLTMATVIKEAFQGGWVEKIINCVSYAGALASIVSDFVKIFETLSEAADLEEVPACDFGKLKDHHYQHPGDGEEF